MNSSPQSAARGRPRLPSQLVVVFAMIGFAVFLTGILAQGGSSASAQERTTYFGCAAFSGEEVVCEPGVTIDSLKVHQPYGENDYTGDRCDNRYGYVKGHRHFTVRDGCLAMFEITYSSGETARPDPFRDDWDNGWLITCELGGPNETRDCNAGGPIAAARPFDGDCRGGLRWQTGDSVMQTRNCNTSLILITLPCQSPVNGVCGGTQPLTTADMACASVDEGLTRCIPAVSDVQSVLIKQAGRGSETCYKEGRPLFEVVDEARGIVEAFSDCEGTFAVTYRGSSNDWNYDTERPYERVRVRCAANGPDEVQRCDTGVTGVQRVAEVPISGSNCRPGEWRQVGNQIEVTGCIDDFNVYYNGSVTAKQKTGNCFSSPEDDRPSDWVVCDVMAEGIIGVQLVRGEESCAPVNAKPRWYRSGRMIHVYANCNGDFTVTYTGRDLGAFKPAANSHFSMHEMACGVAQGTQVCPWRSDNRIIGAYLIGAGETNNTCAEGQYFTTGDGLEVRGCSGTFIVYTDDVLKMPFPAGESWVTYVNNGHGDGQIDMEPANGGTSQVVAVATGMARYVCSIERENGGNGAHALIRLTTEQHGEFTYLHLDTDDAEERFGGTGQSRWVVQGEILGVLDTAEGVFEDTSSNCEAHSDSIHLHLDFPTDLESIEGQVITSSGCTSSYANRSQCPLTSTNIARQPVDGRAPETGLPRIEDFEGQIVKLRGNTRGEPAMWVEGGIAYHIPTVAVYERCLGLADGAVDHLEDAEVSQAGWTTVWSPKAGLCEADITPEPPTPEPPTPGPVCQMLTNGDFSNGLNGWQSTWGQSAAEAGGMAVTNGVRVQGAEATPGTSYTVTGNYRTVGHTGGRDIGIDFLDAAGNKLADQKAGLGQSQTMTGFTATATAPAGTTRILVWVWSGNSGKTIVDDITLGQSTCTPGTPEPPAPEPPAPEPPAPTPPPACQMLTNGDFASGLNDWQATWGQSNAEAGGMALSNGVRVQQVGATAGTGYTLTGDYRTVGHTGGRDVGIDFLDAAGNKLADRKAGLGQSETMTGFTITATAPAGTTDIVVWAWSGNSGKTIVDNFALEPSNC